MREPDATGGLWARPVRGFLLDLDDTLIDTRAAMHSAFVAAAGSCFPQTGPVVHAVLAEHFYADPGGRFDAYTRGELSFVEQRRTRYVAACAAAGLAHGGWDGFQAFEDAYIDAFRASQLTFPDVPAFFGALRQAGIPACIVTNSGDDQTRLKVSASGLPEDLPTVTTDTFGVGKPDRRMYDHGCDLIGVTPDEAVCVGDSLWSDVMGARSAGLRAIWVQRPGQPAPRRAGWGTPVSDPGVRVVQSLAEVPGLLG